MKIGLFTLAGAWGGTEAHTVRLAQTLERRGHDATVVCLKEGTRKAYQDAGVPTVEVRTVKEPESMNVIDWFRVFSREQWDACVLVKGTFWVGDWKLDVGARLSCKNYITIEHLTCEPLARRNSRRLCGIFPWERPGWYREWFRRFLRSVGPKKVVCVSDAVRRRLAKDYCFPARKLVTARNGVDVQRFCPDLTHSEAWRRRWGISSTALTFGAVGRLASMKGYDIALAGFQGLLDGFPEQDIRLVLIGEGPGKDALEEMASRIVPAGRVVFSPFCDRPWEPLNALDVFIMPSRNEGLPLALLEAMACGACPVATAVGGIPEVLTGPELGWLVPAGQDEAFNAAMIAAAARTPGERATMGARAREHVVANFNAAVQFDALVEVLESLRRAPRGRRETPRGLAATDRRAAEASSIARRKGLI
jgi:glycosyltransferase involved in cell wall biosynthesis